MFSRRHIFALLLSALLLSPPATKAQTVLYNYLCTSEVLNVTQDNHYWVDMTNATLRLSEAGGRPSSGAVSIGFRFYYMGMAFQSVEITSTGRVYFGGRTGSESMFIQPFCDSLRLGPFGRVSTLVSGSPGQRVFTAEFSQRTSSFNVQLQWQLQLSEADNSIRIVMRETGSIVTVGNTINLVGQDWEMLSVNVGQCTFDVIQNQATLTTWPRHQTRYVFLFTPVTLCGHPTGIRVSQVTDTAATVWWTPVEGASRYEVEYGPAGFTSGTVTETRTPRCRLSGLSAYTRYEVRLRTVCGNGQGSDLMSRTFYTLCGNEDEHTFVYWNLCDSNVMCSTGTRIRPSTIGRGVDSGSSSIQSRHTVHSDPSEFDLRTDNLLRTVPEGYCYSVRLGNWRGGGEQEAITYRVTVDTGKSDLLLLRYAIVEEDPSHPPEEQPYFTFSVLDRQGNVIDPCLHADFVAGDLSGWNVSGADSSIVWHDWMAVGVDLSSYHGQEVQVTLDNADCTWGAHFSYAYFVLEYASKRIKGTSCGENVENTFSAPPGFAYQWYNADNPAVILSANQSLHVTSEGTYCCRVTYLHTTGNCGFTLTTYSGPRYPVARFSPVAQNGCGSEVLFVNQSVVATDAIRQILTAEPCESYLWKFDDGSTSTLTNPTHTFLTDGPHAVTLIAMLADGTCTDSCTSTVTVHFPHDTTLVTICPGDVYAFHGEECLDSGFYTFMDTCGPHILHIAYYPAEGLSQDTTVCVDALPMMWHDTLYTGERSDTLHLKSVNGCDSLVVSSLHVRPHAHMPIAVTKSCSMPIHYQITLSPNGYTYRWAVSPAVVSTAQENIDSLVCLHFYPTEEARLAFLTDYADAPSCPGTDTVDLTIQDYAIFLDLEVRPETLMPGDSRLVAHDKSLGIVFRQWKVDSVVQQETGAWLEYEIPPETDSVLVVLIGGDSTCVDTVWRIVPVIKEDLFFPNVFTPGRDDNNLFRVLGSEVESFELWIYDRRGVQVFHTNDINEGWDGVHCSQGTYTYICRYTMPVNQSRLRKGTVTLIR